MATGVDLKDGVLLDFGDEYLQWGVGVEVEGVGTPASFLDEGAQGGGAFFGGNLHGADLLHARALCECGRFI